MFLQGSNFVLHTVQDNVGLCGGFGLPYGRDDHLNRALQIATLSLWCVNAALIVAVFVLTRIFLRKSMGVLDNWFHDKNCGAAARMANFGTAIHYQAIPQKTADLLPRN